MAVAGGNAAVPPDGKRVVGGPDLPSDETNGARVALPLPRVPGCVARVYQENAIYA